MKNLICFFLLISFFSFSQVEIPIIDFASGDYPVGEKVKILYDKDGKPVTEIDSATFYRIVKFKEKNIPSSRVVGFYITGEKQRSFYASYIGLTLSGKDSVCSNGPSVYYHKNGNKSLISNFFNNKKDGSETSYYESNKIESKSYFEEGLKQGEEINYYESGKIRSTLNWIDGLAQGEEIRYYESGEVEFKTNWVDNLKQGEVIGYHESGVIMWQLNWVDDLAQGEQIGYYESGAIMFKVNWVDDLIQGEFISYYESGVVKTKVDFVDNLEHGQKLFYSKDGEITYAQLYNKGIEVGDKDVFYYDSGKTKTSVELQNGKKQGEQIGYYESGEVEYKINWVDNLKQGEQIGYYESGEVEYKRNWVDDLKQGEEFFYFKSGEVDYNLIWKDGELQERRIALVIGNASYNKGSLENPVNDANLIAESLEKLDFEVFLHTDLATEDEMLDAIKDFGRKRKNYEVAFIYYAGHGIQLNNENYLLPVNEEFEFEDDVEDNGVSMQRILRYLESTRENQLNFIVLDACRDNPFESNWNKTRSIKGGGLAKIPPPTGSLIAFSTDHGQTAADGDGGNSLYSQALAEKLLEENVSIEQVFKNVRTEVLRLSGDTQSPVEESKLTGDAFYLNKTNK
jgi:antitoxin component YwqK of YwqJK toxin-antitoxin module